MTRGPRSTVRSRAIRTLNDESQAGQKSACGNSWMNRLFAGLGHDEHPTKTGSWGCDGFCCGRARGKLVVLNFWASYCGSCREEIPDLHRLQERIRSRGGVVLAVSIDENCSSYEDFLKIHPVRFQTACEPTKKVSLDYGTVMIPETYVIDRQGYTARKIVGPQEWESPEMTKYFDAALTANLTSYFLILSQFHFPCGYYTCLWKPGQSVCSDAFGFGRVVRSYGQKPSWISETGSRRS